jgi:hypothetical protein
MSPIPRVIAQMRKRIYTVNLNGLIWGTWHAPDI